MNLRQVLIDAARSHFAGHINKHIANIEVLLNNPAGIGEHQDIQEAIEIELGHIADYHDKLEMLTKFFMQKKGEDNVERTEEE
jgi:short-subunit dehydrogenase involved in D-alanine esterification of teichoic acids